MSQIRTIFKNMSWLFISQIIASICAFVWTILMARYLGVSEYGVLGFAISFSGMFGITLDFGISTHIIRHISTNNDSAPVYLGNAIPLKSIFSIGTFVIILIILILLKSSELTITITLLFTIELIIKSFIGIFNGTFQAFEKAEYQGIGNIILNIILLIFILLTVYFNLGIFIIAISYILANVIVFIYTIHVLRKHIVRPKLEFDKILCKKITLVSLPFAVTGILYSIYYSIDVVMLTSMVGNYATGIYNATYKLVSVLTLFYSVYTTVIFPVMSKFYKNNEKLLLISFEKSIKYLMLVMVPIAVMTMFYSLDIIQLFYGHEYDPASSVLSILIWTVCLLFISGAFNTLLNASYKELSVTKIYSVAAIFNIILNFFLIPIFSYDGAAITTVLSDILIVFLEIHVLYKCGKRPNKKLYFDLSKIFLGTFILSIIIHILNLNFWIAIPSSIIIYLVIMVILKIFDEDDKYIIKEILNKN